VELSYLLECGMPSWWLQLSQDPDELMKLAQAASANGIDHDDRVLISRLFHKMGAANDAAPK